jgi:hypothetical protein
MIDTVAIADELSMLFPDGDDAAEQASDGTRTNREAGAGDSPVNIHRYLCG